MVIVSTISTIACVIFSSKLLNAKIIEEDENLKFVILKIISQYLAHLITVLQHAFHIHVFSSYIVHFIFCNFYNIVT